MINWAPLHLHSHIGSLLDGISRPETIASTCEELGYTSCALTDHGSIAGCIDFTKVLKSKNIKPIRGIEFYICDEPAKIKGSNVNKHHLVVLAKNLAGWKGIIKAVTEANKKENFFYNPRLSLEELASFIDNNCVVFSGHLGSHFSNYIDECEKWIDKFKGLFGKENVFIEIQRIDRENISKIDALTDRLREIAKSTQTQCVATADSHYCKKEDAADQRVVLCSNLKTTLNKVYRDIQKGNKVALEGFFKSNNYHIPSLDELKELHTEDEIMNSLLISDMCEDYNIFSKPDMPGFDCPTGMNNNSYFRQLCKEGLCNLGLENSIYSDRMNYELSVLEKYNLTGYFLVVRDFVDWAKKQGYYLGRSRGCLHKNSLVLTKTGYKKISNIVIGDMVYSRDGLLHEVKNLFKYQSNEKLLKINTYYGDKHGVILTKDHKILGQKKQFTKLYQKTKNDSYRRYEPVTDNLDWFEAKDLKPRDWMFIPYNKEEKVDIDTTFDLAKYVTNGHNYDDDSVYYYHHNKLCKVVNHTYTCRRYIRFDEDLAFIFGLFIGDGWISKNKEKNSIGFAFNSTELDAMYFVLDYFERLGCITRIIKHKKKKLYQLMVNNFYIKKLFKELWDEYEFKSKTKYIPQIIKNSSRKNLISLIKGIIESDGNICTKRGRNKITISSTSIRLAYDIKEVCFKLNKVATLSFSNRKDRRKHIKNKNWIEYRINIQVCKEFTNTQCKTNYRFKQISNGYLVQIQDITEINNDDNFVYDIEVDGEHNYLSSNGIVHNSAGGCLVSYLTGITRLDPIPNGLIFERFYNEGRNTDDHVALPDIDIDFPKGAREHIVEYIKGKYGSDRVGHILTHQRIKGKGALKEVLRAHEVCSAEQMNIITKDIPDEAKISDKLQEMRDEGRDSSIILWALENIPEKFSEWCYLEGDELKGDYARYFAQAIRLEGINKSRSQHASGIVIGNKPLTEYCPVIMSKSGEQCAGWEMGPLELIGLTKFDLLGVVTLNKLVTVKELLRKY